MYEYKVVRIITGAPLLQNEEQKIAEEVKMEATVNELAGQGWRLISTSAYSMSNRGILVLFFERETS